MKKFLFYLEGLSVIATLSFSSTFAYTQEQRDAYDWAHEYGIISANTIDSANLNGVVTKQALSKMIITYIENTEGIRNTSKSCSFTDEYYITPSLRSPAKKMCAYNLMGTNGQNFFPTAPVNNAQLGTVLSRVLWGDQYNTSGKGYYIYHINALQKAGIMDNINNPLQTIATRGEVLVMLKRMYNNYGGNQTTTTKQVNTIKSSSSNIISCKDNQGELTVNTDTLDWSFTYTDDKGKNTCAYHNGKYFCSDSKKNITYPTASTKEPAYTCKDSKGQLSVFANGGYGYVKGNFSSSNTSGSKENNTKATSGSSNSKTKTYDDSEILYTASDGTKYIYDGEFLTFLASKAKKKGANDLYNYLTIEAAFYNDYLTKLSNLDEDSISEMLGIDLDSIDSDKLSHKEKEKLVATYKSGFNKFLNEIKKDFDKYAKELKKMAENTSNDKYKLKDKYQITKDFFDATTNYLSSYFDTLLSILDLSLQAEEAEGNEELSQELAGQQLASVFSLLGTSMIYESASNQYDDYLNKRSLDTIDILDGKAKGYNRLSGEPNNNDNNKTENNQSENNANETLSTAEINKIKENGVIYGPKNARFTILEFADASCGYCRRQIGQDKTIDQVMAKYPKDVNMMFKNMPIFNEPAAEAMACSEDYLSADSYHKFITAVFQMDDATDISAIAKLASKYGADANTITKCVNNGYKAEEVATTMNESQIFGISGTPSSVIIDNQSGKYKVIPGAYPAETFIDTIEAFN